MQWESLPPLCADSPSQTLLFLHSTQPCTDLARPVTAAPCVWPLLSHCVCLCVCLDVHACGGTSLDIAPGETVAFVGDSGSGKSTLLQLLQRMYDPLEGSVTLDGAPLPSLNVQSLRGVLGVVAQEPKLFNVSLRDSIAMGAAGPVTEEEVVSAAQTVIGDQGSTLSGGQKQRVAIARAIIRKPRLLLLDEATSALDSESEREVSVADSVCAFVTMYDRACVDVSGAGVALRRSSLLLPMVVCRDLAVQVQAALDRVVAENSESGTTAVVVAHRLSTIMRMDRVVVMRQGAIVESGSPAQLLQADGVFARWVLSVVAPLPPPPPSFPPPSLFPSPLPPPVPRGRCVCRVLLRWERFARYAWWCSVVGVVWPGECVGRWRGVDVCLTAHSSLLSTCLSLP